MEITFLGHNGWLLEKGESALLMDPLLLDYFGNCIYHDFYMYPCRDIDLSYLSKVKDVIITHEHSDHYHIDSISALPKSITFHLGPLAPNFMEFQIKELGFNVNRISFNKIYNFNEIYIKFYPAAQETVFWEGRVIQSLVSNNKLFDNPVFFAVDALISEGLINDINSGKVNKLLANCLSNNSVIVEEGELSPMDNILYPEMNNENGAVGLSLFKELLIDYQSVLPTPKYSIIAGGGILGDNKIEKPYPFDRQSNLLDAFNHFLPNEPHVLSPDPGDKLVVVNNTISKSTNSGVKIKSIKKVLPRTLKQKPVFSNEAILKSIENELKSLCKPILHSEIAHVCQSIGKHNNKKLDDIKILFRFHDQIKESYYDYGLNFHSSKFEQIDSPNPHDFPFGIQFDIHEFHLLISGHIQIWNMAGRSMQNWFFSEKTTSLLTFLYCYYGEQVQPQLANTVWKKTI